MSVTTERVTGDDPNPTTRKRRTRTPLTPEQAKAEADRRNMRASARKDATAERERQVIELWLHGWGTDEIADRLDLNDSSVRAIRKRVMERRAAEWQPENVDALRDAEVARLDRLMRAHQPAALGLGQPASPRSAQIVLACVDRRAKLLGLDAPVKIAATVRSELDAEIEQMISTLRDKGVVHPEPAPAS